MEAKIQAHKKSEAMPLLLWGAWLLQGLWLAYTLQASPLRFGFAPALSMAVWLAVAVYAIEKRFYPALKLHPVWLLAVCVSFALSLIYPGHALDASVSVWLPLHSAFGLASYALFAVAVFHAWQLGRKEDAVRHSGASNWLEEQIPNSDVNPVGMPLLTIERLMFNFVLMGFILLSATLVLGLGFREHLYGPHYLWRWEHKTIFAMLAWVVFALLLGFRFALGWRGRVAVRMVYAGAAVLLLSYVGSRFVLEVLLGR